ncbi:Deoxyribonuclease Tat-D [Candida viswanathii]|uniref:Deoxyribonuclease Tat-D n=1 Tax=Candida viswanathii TaxID=5486 RepID=A0A367YBI2_9ASCO|nr:Deoxyribonuclease Tat-D [Candida viswanathii]
MSTSNSSSPTSWRPRYYDIGVNFSDAMFQGYYNGSSARKHPSDISAVIERAHLFHVDKMLITASTIQESRDHFALCEQYPTSSTPPRACTLAPWPPSSTCLTNRTRGSSRTCCARRGGKLRRLKEIIIEGHKQGHVKAFGEIGLDYDRLHYSTKHQQCEMFIKQLDLLKELKELELPLFLHMRAACDDFIAILKPYIDSGVIAPGNGVVHSFTGTQEELDKLLDLGFYIGINGCSLKTQENLDVAARIPVDRLMIETDAPWCEIRKSHAGYKYLSLLPEIKNERHNGTLPKTTFKLDENLPFPSLKRDHYVKHKEYVQTTRENAASPELLESRIGLLSEPMIKSRNEPVNVGLVAEILCALHGLKEEHEIEQFIDTVFENSCTLFKTS